MRVRIALEDFLLDWPKGPAFSQIRDEFSPFANDSFADTPVWQVQALATRELFPFVDESRNARLDHLDGVCRIVLKNGQWALLDEKRRDVRLYVDEGFFNDPLAAYCTLSSFLRLALSVLLPKRGGLVLHASSLADGEVARVFAGVSGAGKSTVCSLAQGRAVFGDEIALLTKNADGGYLVHPGPFFAEERLGPRVQGPLPLGGIYLLKQAHEDALERLSFAQATAGFLGVALMADDTAEGAEPLLDAALHLWQEGRISGLAFRKADAFWRLFAPTPS